MKYYSLTSLFNYPKKHKNRYYPNTYHTFFRAIERNGTLKYLTKTRINLKARNLRLKEFHRYYGTKEDYLRIIKESYEMKKRKTIPFNTAVTEILSNLNNKE